MHYHVVEFNTSPLTNDYRYSDAMTAAEAVQRQSERHSKITIHEDWKLQNVFLNEKNALPTFCYEQPDREREPGKPRVIRYVEIEVTHQSKDRCSTCETLRFQRERNQRAYNEIMADRAARQALS